MDEVLIQEAGVGEQFSALSIRGAASTAAVMKGMSISEVLRIADWSSDNVFKIFYFKPTDTRPQSLSIQLLMFIINTIMTLLVMINIKQ